MKSLIKILDRQIKEQKELIDQCSEKYKQAAIDHLFELIMKRYDMIITMLPETDKDYSDEQYKYLFY